MYLSQSTEYALRALAHLATLPEEGAMRASDLASATLVPAHYLSKVLRRLASAGILEARKGPGGGFALARAPSRIRISDVLDAMGEAPDANHCAFGWGRCDARHPCPLHGVFSSMKASMDEWAGASTLEDVRRFAAEHPPGTRARRRVRLPQARTTPRRP
jgi:Rrf2 family protein